MIDVKNLHKYFGSLEVLKGIDCHIDKGECVCVIGPSGSGKSTFLRCLNLLETPTKGDIVIDDMHLTEKNFDVDAMRKRVGMVFQHFNLFPHLTILENVTLAPIRHKMMTEEQIQHNVECFKKQMSHFIDFSDDKAIIVNNGDWLLDLNYVDVLRDVGACFSVNKMLTFECYKQRMERGLTFLEFNYMIMQSYDFYRLFQDYGCNMQFGGDDQWANMLGGTELIRKKLGKDAYAMTITLLLNSEGKKMGKTEKGAVWLDPEKTSPYEFYQYWRNVGDADVIKCLKMLTFVPIEEIEEMEKHMEGAEYNKAKELLAYELTKLVHGKEEADKADAAAKAIFAGGGNSDDMPSTTIAAADLTDGKIGILTLLVKCGLCPSNGEARRLVTQNGIAVNGEKFTDPKGLVDLSEPVVIKKGKKIFHKAIAE